MSDRAEHRERWHDEIAAYSLDALDEREAALLEHHLAECKSCSERLNWITLAVDQLPGAVDQVPAPPALRDRLMAVVNEEAAAAGSPRPEPQSSRRWSWLPSFEGFAMRPAIAGVAAALLLIAGVAGYELRNGTSTSGPGTAGEQVAALPLQGSSASGTLTVHGDEGSLRVADLPPAGKGDVYQAWIKDQRGSVHPSSVFVLSDNGTGVVSIPEGLSHADQVMVTREPKGGSKLPTESPFLAAKLD